MNSFQDIFSKLILKNEHTVKRICSPLKDCLGISVFCYGRVEADGLYVNLTNYPLIEELYYANQHYLCDPHLVTPLLLRSGAFLIPNCSPADYMSKILKQSNTGQSLLILERNEDVAEFFLFGINAKENNPETKLLNYLIPLHNFIHYFKREAKPIIDRSIKEKYNVKSVRKKLFSEPTSSPLSIKDPQIERFLNLIYPLTARERQCLDLFKQGKTAQMTGAILGLSQRTVEHYFDNIKNKLGCKNKSDLLLW
jgi:DNA-binding CsgD family transcriptional regulator